jgi:glycosyltransferase involved in cell wall biosynthesis
MSKENFLFVTQFFPPADEYHQTGGTISNRNLIRFLARDNEVTVLTFDPSAEPKRFFKEPFQVIQRVPPLWDAYGLLLYWQRFVRQQTIKAIETSRPPNFLIATTSTLAAFDVAPTSTICLAVVRAFENFGWRCNLVPWRSRLNLAKGAILRRFEDGRLMRRADGVLTNSAFMSEAIASRFEIPTNRIHVLRQQIDFSPTIERPPKDTVGFVHRGPDKNIAYVLDLARKAPDLSFLVYGHSSGLPADLPGNMSVVGWATNRASMFASARLWLIPSLWAEPFGRVSIEAQAAKRAVLVANRGGLSETVADPRYLIDGFEAEAWLKRMRDLLSLSETELEETGDRIQKIFSAAAHDNSIQAAIGIIKNRLGP